MRCHYTVQCSSLIPLKHHFLTQSLCTLVHMSQLGMSLWNGLLQPFINTISTCNGQLQSKIKRCLVSFPKSVHVLCRSFQKLCMVAALCTQIISASGTIAAVTKVQCLCDVSCCLAMDLEIQRSSSRTAVRTWIKFCTLLGKRAVECYKSLKDACSFIRNSLPMGACH